MPTSWYFVSLWVNCPLWSQNLTQRSFYFPFHSDSLECAMQKKEKAGLCELMCFLNVRGRNNSPENSPVGPLYCSIYFSFFIENIRWFWFMPVYLHHYALLVSILMRNSVLRQALLHHCEFTKYRFMPEYLRGWQRWLQKKKLKFSNSSQAASFNVPPSSDAWNEDGLQRAILGEPYQSVHFCQDARSVFHLEGS